MSLFVASLILSLGLASACSYQPKTVCYFNNECVTSAARTPAPSDRCVVSKETLMRVLRWIATLICQLQESGQITKEPDATNTNQSRNYPKSFSFFPVYYQNNMPGCFPCLR